MRAVHIYGLSVITLAGLIFAGVPAHGAGFDRSQYDVIVDAHPFGVVAPKVTPGVGPNGEALVKDEAPKVPFSATFKLTMIRRDDVVGDVCAIDDTKNPSWHAYLGVGEETPDGIVVRKIDLDAKGVLLGKADRDDEWLFLGGGTGGVQAGTPSRVSRISGISRHRVTPVVSRSSAVRSFPATASRPKIDPEKQLPPGEMQKHLEDYNMELILSAGEKGPALPIPLTPEQDDALVGAGILPPAE